MHALLLAAVLATSADAGVDANPYAVAAEEIAPKLQTGSLLFSEGDCLAVRIFTASPYTHVAIATVSERGPVVYDSTNGFGVRKLPFAEYLKAQSPDELHLFHLQQPLTPERAEKLRAYLESQLGRPYGIQHHLTGKRAEGVHCSEYVTDALMSINVIAAQRPSKVSPASLVTGITREHIYRPEETMDLSLAEPPPPKGRNWCHQLWIDTKLCTQSCCAKLSGWFLCR